MEKSIEDIWKTGFVNDNAFSIPKINDLYNRKSIDVTERIIRLFKYNVWGLYAFAVAFLVYSILSVAAIFPAVVIFVMFFAAGWYTKSHIKHLQTLDKNVSSYQYLKSIKSWLSNQLTNNIKLARIFYPICILASISMVWFTEGSEIMANKFLEHYPNHITIGNMPLAFLVFIIAFPLLFILFTKPIYKFDVKLVYGRVFKKLDQLIADFEELRS